MYFEKIFEKDTIFICGENEEFKPSVLIFLLELGVKHFYFVHPGKMVQKYLTETVEQTLFSIVESINDISLGDNNLIICGFSQISGLPGKLKNFKNNAVIFYNTSLGIFRSQWNNFKNIDIFEQPVSSILDNSSVCKEFADKPVKSEDDFFTNRGQQLKEHRDFIAEKNKRCCKIIGMKGIGKHAFIRYLKLTQGLKDNCFEISFIGREDDINYLLSRLLQAMGVAYRQDEMENLKLDKRKRHHILEKLFSEFDKIGNARIIFTNFDEIYNFKKRNFYDPNIEIFFHHLLNRESFNQNRFYIVANENFDFSSQEDRNLTNTILLSSMHSEQIQLILEREFNVRSKNENAQAIIKYDHDTIGKLLGGHPQIARLFVQACDNFPMDDLINDPMLRNKFDQEKVKYLMSFIKLVREEEELLFYLSLFKVAFNINAITGKFSDPVDIIQNLRQKLLLEKEDLEHGHSVYYIPSIIRDYALVKMDRITYLNNHNLIGQYYWNEAENLKNPPSRILECYRLSLYHFEQAEKNERKERLMLYFKGIFINRARELYEKKDYENAHSYYSELSEMTKLYDKDFTFFLVCKIKLKKEGIDELYEKADKEYPGGPFINNTYANYLFDKGDYEPAELISRKVYENYPDIDGASGELYSRILYKMGQKEKAVEIIEKRIAAYESNLNGKNITFLIKAYMSYYNMLDYYNVFSMTVSYVIYLLKTDGVYLEQAELLFKQPLKNNVEKINSFFNRALNNQNCDKILIYNYVCHLKRQNKLEDAGKILDIARSKKIINEDIKKYIDSVKISYINEKMIEPTRFNDSKIMNYFIEIEKSITNCEEILEKSYLLLKKAIDIEPDNFLVLNSTANMLRCLEDFYTLKKIVNICYDNNLKEEFLRGHIMKKVFISYNHKDIDFVKRLKEALERSSVKITVDTESMKYGDNINDFIKISVRDTDFTISVISENSLLSSWVMIESLETFKYEEVLQKKKFIPIFIDKSIFDDKSYLKSMDKIDESIEVLNTYIKETMTRNIDFQPYSNKVTKLRELKNNSGKIIAKLQETLIGDFTGTKFDESLNSLIDAINYKL